MTSDNKQYKDMSIEDLETSDYLRGDMTPMDRIIVVLWIIFSLSFSCSIIYTLYLLASQIIFNK